MVIALAAAAASLSEHPSTAAILVLAFTVGTWVLGFVAAFQGGVWEMIAGYTPAEMLQAFRSGLMRLDLMLAAFIIVAASLMLAAVWMRLGVAVRRRLGESASILCVASVLGVAISFVNLSLDVSENERNSFDEAEEALLESIAAPLKITVNLAPEDPRRFDLEKQTLSKLRRTMSRVTITYVSASATGLFEQAREHYGEIWYELGGKRIAGRSMTRDGVLDAIYELAGLAAPQEGEAGHRGHPLAAQPIGAVPLFYVAWPLAVMGLGLFLHRRRLT
jgi:ABC-2 type transport system permease protein